MSTYEPDKWVLSAYGGSATWGTDADVNTSVYNSGDASIEFKNTTPSGEPCLYTYDYYPVQPGFTYLCDTCVRSDSVAAGNVWYGGIEWYTAAKAYDSQSVFLNNVVLSAADTWLEYSVIGQCPATAFYARPFIRKHNHAFTGYVDRLGLRRTPRSFRAYCSGATAVGVTSEIIAFNTEVYDYGSVFDTTNYCFIVPRTGIYSLSASLFLASVPDGEYSRIYFFVKPDGGAYAEWAASPTFQAGRANGDLGASLSITGYLTKGDSVAVYMDHGDTVADYNTYGGSLDSIFTATEWL